MGAFCDSEFASKFDPEAMAPSRLVAETGADGDLVTALRAAAAQHIGAGLSLHPRKEAVGLRAMAAVRLKGTLRHDKTPMQERDSRSNF